MALSSLSTSFSRAVVRGSKLLSRKGLYPFLDAQFDSIPAGTKVLSVGAGGVVTERLLAVAKRRGFEVRTFDIDPARGPDIVGDICTHDFGAERFDAVILAEILEHLHAPHQALDNVRTILQPGGLAVITVPFLLPIHERPVDYFRFTRYGLAHLLRDFVDVSIQERNSWAESLGVIPARIAVERGRRARLAGPVLVAWALATTPLLKVMSRLVPTDFATTGYLVRARAPSRTTSPL